MNQVTAGPSGSPLGRVLKAAVPQWKSCIYLLANIHRGTSHFDCSFSGDIRKVMLLLADTQLLQAACCLVMLCLWTAPVQPILTCRSLFLTVYENIFSFKYEVLLLHNNSLIMPIFNQRMTPLILCEIVALYYCTSYCVCFCVFFDF